MALNGYVFETRGGAILAEFEPMKATWQWAGNPAETLDVTINLASIQDSSRAWRNLASEWNHCLAVDIGGGRYIGGPIMPHDFDDDARTLKLTARGIRVLLERQYVLPVSALTVGVVDDNNVPRASQNTVLANLDYGTIGKRLVQQLRTWPSWSDVPIVFHDDRPGKRFRTYPALDFENVDAALADLSELENGPDIRFELQKVGDAFQWEYRSGTETQPRLVGDSVFAWTLGEAAELKVKTDPTQMASVFWSVAGRADDKALVAMLYDPTLVNGGGILMHKSTGVSSNETDVLALRRWNVETARTSGKPAEFWTFRVPTNRSPAPFEYAPGDLAEIVITRDTPVAGGYLQPGEYQRRIAALSGSADSAWIDVTCGEFYG